MNREEETGCFERTTTQEESWFLRLKAFWDRIIYGVQHEIPKYTEEAEEEEKGNPFLPKLRSILISSRRTRAEDSETAPEDRDKLPLLGCIYCAVAFPWLFCEIVIILVVFALVLLKSDFLYSPFMTDLISICEFLFVNKYFWIFITGMPLLYQIDYFLGLRRWQKRRKQ